MRQTIENIFSFLYACVDIKSFYSFYSIHSNFIQFAQKSNFEKFQQIFLNNFGSVHRLTDFSISIRGIFQNIMILLYYYV